MKCTAHIVTGVGVVRERRHFFNVLGVLCGGHGCGEAGGLYISSAQHTPWRVHRRDPLLGQRTGCLSDRQFAVNLTG